MELRRVSEALLRTQTSPFSIIYTPSIAARWQSARQHLPQSHSSKRTFAINPTKRSITTTARSPLPETPSKPTATSPSAGGSTDELLEQLSKNLWADPAKSSAGGVSQSERRNNAGGSSSAELLRQIQLQGTKPSPSSRASSLFDISQMQMPSDGGKLNLEGVKTDITTTMPLIPRVPLRLNPATGRTVHVNDKVDITTAIRKMEILVARNKVKQDFNYQRYHERPGMKRKRLRRLRWRTNFKASFKATVARVQELRKQGW